MKHVASGTFDKILEPWIDRLSAIERQWGALQIQTTKPIPARVANYLAQYPFARAARLTINGDPTHMTSRIVSYFGESSDQSAMKVRFSMPSELQQHKGLLTGHRLTKLFNDDYNLDYIGENREGFWVFRFNERLDMRGMHGTAEGMAYLSKKGYLFFTPAEHDNRQPANPSVFHTVDFRILALQ